MTPYFAAYPQETVLSCALLAGRVTSREQVKTGEQPLAGHAMLPQVSFLARLRTGSPGHKRSPTNGSDRALELRLSGV